MKSSDVHARIFFFAQDGDHHRQRMESWLAGWQDHRSLSRHGIIQAIIWGQEMAYGSKWQMHNPACQIYMAKYTVSIPPRSRYDLPELLLMSCRTPGDGRC
jgi:hypothetical protein